MSYPSPTFGIHALVWAGGTSRDEVDMLISKAATTGYDILELSLHDMDRLDTAAARSAAQQAGVTITCSRGLAFDADVSHDDPAVVARGVEVLRRSVAACVDLGAPILTGALYSALGKYGSPLSSAGRANAVAALRDVAGEADRHGIRLGLEVCNRYETNVVNTARQALRLIDDVGADNIFVHLDTYHMNIEESDVVAPVVEVGDRLGYVHIGENHRGYLGSGSIDFFGLFRALDRIGFAGPIVFESFSSAVVSPTLSNDLAIWRNLWSDGDDLARHALTYLRSAADAAQAASASQ